MVKALGTESTVKEAKAGTVLGAMVATTWDIVKQFRRTHSKLRKRPAAFLAGRMRGRSVTGSAKNLGVGMIYDVMFIVTLSIIWSNIHPDSYTAVMSVVHGVLDLIFT